MDLPPKISFRGEEIAKRQVIDEDGLCFYVEESPIEFDVSMENEDTMWKRFVSVIFTIPYESIDINWCVLSITFNDKIGDKWPYILWINVDM